MLINLIIGLNAAAIVLLLIVILKQFLSHAATERNENNISLQLTALKQQAQSNEQKISETMLTRFSTLQQTLIEKLMHASSGQVQQFTELKEQLQVAFTNHRTRFDERQMDTLKILQETLQKISADNRVQLKEALADYAGMMSTRVEQLTKTTETKLQEINHQVEKRLVDGFVKTNETFHDVIKRLALIDVAQKKITELSSNVVSLQELLNDKRSRGAFGEVQLSALICNMIPENHFSFQHSLSNHRRPDCMLFLPEPTGNIAIDAKFPLENFRTLIDVNTPAQIKQQAEKQFKIDMADKF